jgi:hypothetical protein
MRGVEVLQRERTRGVRGRARQMVMRKRSSVDTETRERRRGAWGMKTESAPQERAERDADVWGAAGRKTEEGDGGGWAGKWRKDGRSGVDGKAEHAEGDPRRGEVATGKRREERREPLYMGKGMEETKGQGERDDVG